MIKRLKAYLATPKGKLIAAVSVLLLSWIFLFVQMSGDLLSWVPSESRRADAKKRILKLREENKVIQQKLRKIDSIRKQYAEKKKSAWDMEKDGDPEIILRQMVQEAARKTELKLNNFGSVRISRLNHELCYAELDVSANASYETILKFIAAVRELKPVLCWRRFNLNADMRNNRGNTSARKTEKKSTSTGSMMFSGTLRVTVLSPDEKEGGRK